LNAAALATAVVVGYLLGSVSPADLAARRVGIDLHRVGSGNVGATNAGRVLGRRAGVVIALIDVAKGFVPAYGFGLWHYDAGLAAGAAAVIGHVTSPWLRGRGGRGVATAGGAVLASHPLWAVPVVLTWVVVVAVSRWVGLASICAAGALLVVAAVTRPPAASWAWAVALAAVIWWRHRTNVRRWWESRGA
jgi:glycerol-3-phosphate acyltransferase PlsY